MKLPFPEAPWRITGQSEGGRYIKIDANGRTIIRVPFTPEKIIKELGLADDQHIAVLATRAPDMFELLHKAAQCNGKLPVKLKTDMTQLIIDIQRGLIL